MTFRGSHPVLCFPLLKSSALRPTHAGPYIYIYICVYFCSHIIAHISSQKRGAQEVDVLADIWLARCVRPEVTMRVTAPLPAEKGPYIFVCHPHGYLASSE